MHAALQAFLNSDLFNQVVVVLLVVMSVLAWAMMRGKRRQLKAAIRKDASLDRRYRGSAHPACLYVQAQGKFQPDALAANIYAAAMKELLNFLHRYGVSDDAVLAWQPGMAGPALPESEMATVRAAAARLGRELEIHKVPFAEMLPSVKNGTADFAAAAITITDGRLRDADFSDSYAVEGCAFLYRAADTPPTMIRAESLRIGVVESMTGDFYLTRHGIEPFRFSSLPELVANLVSNRLDAVFYDRPALAAEAQASDGLLAVTPLETREHYGIAVRKNRPDLLEAVNAVIRERNGRDAK